MISTIYDFYSHEFITEDGVIVASFTTKTSTEYRVYFYPAKDYFDDVVDGSIISMYGYYFGFTKVAPNEDKKEPFDPRIMNTIVNVIDEFYSSNGKECLLIFHCSSDWGNDKKEKRARRFDEWFERANTKKCFKKYNEEIVVNEFVSNEGITTVDKEFMSIILQCENENESVALEEFRFIKDQLISIYHLILNSILIYLYIFINFLFLNILII